MLESSSLFERGYSQAPNSPIYCSEGAPQQEVIGIEKRETTTARTPRIKESADRSEGSMDKN